MPRISHLLNKAFSSNKMGDAAYLSLLLAVAVISHIPWFTHGTVLFHSDWLHWPTEAARQAWQSQGAWKNTYDLGSPNIQMSFYVVTSVWGLVAHLGGSFDDGVKVSIMVPLAILGFTAPYIFLRQLLSERFAAFLGAIFFGSTTYFLSRQGAHLPIVFVYALSPLIFAIFVKALRSMQAKDWLVFSLLYTVGICYEVRIMYVFSFVLLLYIALFFPIRGVSSLLKYGCLAGAIILGLNLFWLLPTEFGGVASAISQVTSRSLFGNFLFDLPHALSLSDSTWTGGPPNGGFRLQPVLPYLWLVPALILIGLSLTSKMSLKRQRLLAFFMILALSGIFLTKQSGDPLPGAYQWLYSHFPGFSLFREASKFYLLTAWGYMGLLVVCLAAWRRHWPKLFPLAAAGVLAVAFLNLTPLIFGNFGSLFVGRHIPNVYRQVNELSLSQPNAVRTAWIPRETNWGYFDGSHPRTSLLAILQTSWSQTLAEDGLPTTEQASLLFGSQMTEHFLNQASINLLAVPLRDTKNDDDFLAFYGDDPSAYVITLDKVPWLHRINIGTKEVAVYENPGYKPHFSAFTALWGLPGLKNLEDVYKFASAQLTTDFQFVNTKDAPVKHSSALIDPFDQLAPGEIRPGQVVKDVKGLESPSLYVNTNKPYISYTVSGTRVSLGGNWAVNIVAGGKPAVAQNTSRVLGTATLAPGTGVFVDEGGKLIPVMVQPGVHNLGVVGGNVRLVSYPEAANLVPNGSFESGKWAAKVEDCNNYDNSRLISMSVTKDEHTDGAQALELGAFRHTACTATPWMDVTAGGEYALQFDYKTKVAREVSYWVEYNDPAHTIDKQRLPVTDQGWHAYRHVIVPPAGATQARLRLLGLPDDRRQAWASSWYDNVRVAGLTVEADPKLVPAPVYTKVPQAAGSAPVRLVLNDAAADPKNLITNGSFESGLWATSVGDCNAYDSNPAIGMKLANVASDGQKSLELEAQRHTACTSNSHIPVAEATSYLLSFDYQSPNGKQAGYYAQFNDADRTVVSGNLPITGTGWQSFAKTIVAPVGATSLSVTVYAYPDDYGSKKVIDRYDNFKLQRVPTASDQFYLADEAPKVTVPKSVDFTLVNPTWKRVHVKGASGPFYLAMSEAYHDKWQLELNNGRVHGLGAWVPWVRPDKVAGDAHFKLNDFENGWYVDPVALCKLQHGCVRNADGSFDLELVAEFTPQRWFYFGGLISLATLAAVVGYLAWDWRRRRKRRGVKRPPEEPKAPEPKDAVPPPPPPQPPEPKEPPKPPRSKPKPKRRLQLG
jgi:hypothetical protein